MTATPARQVPPVQVHPVSQRSVIAAVRAQTPSSTVNVMFRRGSAGQTVGVTLGSAAS